MKSTQEERALLESSYAKMARVDPGLKALITDLKEKPVDHDSNKIIRRALKGQYDDYQSKDAAPKYLLVANLEIAGFPELAKNAYRGKYDEEKGFGYTTFNNG